MSSRNKFLQFELTLYLSEPYKAGPRKKYFDFRQICYGAFFPLGFWRQAAAAADVCSRFRRCDWCNARERLSARPMGGLRLGSHDHSESSTNTNMEALWKIQQVSLSIFWYIYLFSSRNVLAMDANNDSKHFEQFLLEIESTDDYWGPTFR